MKIRMVFIVLTAVATLAAQQPAQTLLDATREAIANGKAVTKAVTLQYPQSVDGRVLDDIGLVVRRSGGTWVITGTPERVASGRSDSETAGRTSGLARSLHAATAKEHSAHGVSDHRVA